MVRRILATALLAMLAGCAAAPGPRYTLRPALSDGQDVSKVAGRASILESRDPSGVVSIQPTGQLSVYGASFIVVARNVGSAPLSFGPENISVTSGGAPVAIYSRPALEDKVRRHVGAMMKAESRSATGGVRDIAAASYAASNDHSFNNYGGCVGGDGGCRFYNGSDAAYRADENERLLNFDTSVRAAAVLVRDTALVNKRTLAPGAVKPGEFAGGLVVVGHPKIDQKIDIVVTLGGRPHRFSFHAEKPDPPRT